MRRRWALAAALVCAWAGKAQAETAEGAPRPAASDRPAAAQPSAPPASAPGGEPAAPGAIGGTTRAEPPPAAPTTATAPKPSMWEGALGPILGFSPEYAGGSRKRVSFGLGYYLRYGRYSISSGGFANRRNDDVIRGLGIELSRSDRLTASIGLRVDQGRRSADTSAALQGIENVRPTIRMRASANYRLDHGWRPSIGLSTDLLGRGSGNVIDLGIAHQEVLGPGHIRTVGIGALWADGPNMRSYFGVTPRESAASGYPVYVPGAGWREVSLNASWRLDPNPRWTLMWGAGLGRLVGGAAASPLTTSAGTWGLSGAVARRW